MVSLKTNCCQESYRNNQNKWKIWNKFEAEFKCFHIFCLTTTLGLKNKLTSDRTRVTMHDPYEKSTFYGGAPGLPTAINRPNNAEQFEPNTKTEQ